MKKIILVVACGLMLALPNFVFADNGDVIEIPLVEMMSSGFLGGGDSPLDSPGETGGTSVDPNQFRAFISGRSLSVSHSGATLPTQLIVKDNYNNVVVNRQFVQYAAQQMQAGAYTLELHTAASVLQGYFEVRE